MSARLDSNQGPPWYKQGALPTELRAGWCPLLYREKGRDSIKDRRGGTKGPAPSVFRHSL